MAATGVDGVDLAACRDLGITVCNIRGYARTSVPEHVFALVLALRRQLIVHREDLRSGRWSRSDSFCLLEADGTERRVADAILFVDPLQRVVGGLPVTNDIEFHDY